MIKVFDVKEALFLVEGLLLLEQKLMKEENLIDDKTLFNQTLRAVRALRIKYHKVSLTRLRENENGEYEFKDAN